MILFKRGLQTFHYMMHDIQWAENAEPHFWDNPQSHKRMNYSGPDVSKLVDLIWLDNRTTNYTSNRF